MLDKVWYVAEKEESLSQLSAAGYTIGNQVEALLIGSQSLVERASAWGAGKVYYLGQVSEDRMVEDYFSTILALVNEQKPGCVLFWSNKRGRLLAARLAAACETSVLTDTFGLQADGEAVVNKKMVYGGAAFRTEKSAAQVKIACVGDGVFEAAQKDSRNQGEVVEVGFIEPEKKAKRLKVEPKVVEKVNLASAKRVVGIGRGLAQQSDLKMIEEFAAALGAELGCTRPIAEGEKWMAAERYIGISGAMIKPDLYVALGVSGQVQHMSGANQAKTIIAVNKDKQAPIFKQADYGIVGDIYTVIPALIQKLK